MFLRRSRRIVFHVKFKFSKFPPASTAFGRRTCPHSAHIVPVLFREREGILRIRPSLYQRVLMVFAIRACINDRFQSFHFFCERGMTHQLQIMDLFV